MTLAVMFLLLLVPTTNAQSDSTPSGEERLSTVLLTANQNQAFNLNNCL